MPHLPALPAVALVLCAVCASAAPVDYAKLSLKGNGHAEDHFSLSVQAAARLLGRDVDYNTVYVLSTNALAPCFDPGENCTAWWATATGRSVCADLIGRCLGLQFRPVEGPDGKGAPPMPDGGPARDAWFRDYYRKPAVPLIREAQARGEVVLTDREWPVRGLHGFYPWCWWGAIVEARDDGTVLGAGLNGFHDNPLDAVGDMLAVSADDTQMMAPSVADFEVLCRAVSRIRGNAAPFLPGRRAVYGLAAVDLWIARMEQVPFCEACKDRSQGCAYDTARPTYEGAKVAARYLRDRSRAYPAAARSHLVAAAGCYERIAALLEPALSRDGESGYNRIIGDRDRQREHVARVLRPMRAQFRRAADQMCAAMAASLPPAMSLPRIAPGRGEGNAFARGLEVLFAQADTPVDYDTLMGDIGLAFITQASDQAARYGGALDVGWWPLDPCGCSTYLDFAGQAAGRHITYWRGMATWHPAADGHDDTVPLLRVAHALSSGRPVIADHDWWKVITAYDQDQKQPLWGFCPRGQGNVAERLPGQAWAFATVGEPMPRLDRRQADIQALRHAVALGRDGVPMPDGYVTGQKAFAMWAGTLRDVAHLGEARWHSNMVLNLSLNRRSAVAYLSQMATRHPEAVAIHLRAAATLYEQVLRQLSVADTRAAAMTSGAGREVLASLAEGIAALEARAIAELETAATAAG